MARNNIIGMTDMLYEQLQRLMDADTPEAIAVEASRSDAVRDVANTIIQNNRLAFDVVKFMDKEALDPSNEYASKKLLGVGNAKEN